MHRQDHQPGHRPGMGAQWITPIKQIFEIDIVESNGDFSAFVFIFKKKIGLPNGDHVCKYIKKDCQCVVEGEDGTMTIMCA